MINSYSEFQPLKEVVLGQGYPPDYFDCIADAQTRETLQTIFREIEEDFQNIIRTLNQFGVRVVRPGIISKFEFEQSVEHNCPVIPPLTPRDRQVVFGNKLVRLSNWHTFDPLLNYYRNQCADNVIIPRGLDQLAIDGANASCVYRMGRDIWFDQSEWLTPEHTQWLQKNILNDSQYRFHAMQTNGHSDSVFSVLKPGVILTCFHDAGIAYEQDFPGWSQFKVEKPSVERFNNFKNEYHPGITWWVPGKNNLDQFRTFVDQYLNHWIGEIHETVFDVNCLSINTEHVVFACYNKDVFAYCESNGITPILCDLRHRFFFDGGTHCCTLDIEREGGMEDYFG
jgi:hypothetical protein